MGRTTRYDAVFLDVDGTLTWVNPDFEGYASDLAPYSESGLSADDARAPVWKSIKTHIRENINYRTPEELREFRRENAAKTADALGAREAPEEVLAGISERRILFTPYEESGKVLGELKDLGVLLYVVSNWDVLLEEVLEDLGWLGYFDGVVASALVGSEKPDPEIFRAALRQSKTEPSRTIHVGNDAVADVRGASEAGLDTFFVDRKDKGAPPEATYAAKDLTPLPEIVRG